MSDKVEQENGKTIRVTLNKESFDMGSSLSAVTIGNARDFYSNSENELVIKNLQGEDIAIFARGEWLYAEIMDGQST